MLTPRIVGDEAIGGCQRDGSVSVGDEALAGGTPRGCATADGHSVPSVADERTDCGLCLTIVAGEYCQRRALVVLDQAAVEMGDRNVDRTRDVTAAPIRAIADVDHDVVVQ